MAVIFWPVHARIQRRIGRPNIAAALSVALVAAVVLVPIVFVGDRLVRQAVVGVETLISDESVAQFRAALARSQALTAAVAWVESHVDVRGELRRVASLLPALLEGSAWALAQFGVALFALFYFLRDRAQVLAAVGSLVPLSQAERSEVFARVADTIRAIVFGTVSCAFVQGTLGGLMFWWLGLPAPIVWGLVMSLLAMVPLLGAFLVWAPTSIYLAMSGRWLAAAILAGWGGIVISYADNLLYPVLVGQGMRLHTLPVFFAIVGGLATFGPTGVLLGPLTLAVVVGLLEVWRRRMSAAPAPLAEDVGVSAGLVDADVAGQGRKA